MNRKQCSPVILFVYNRPEHTKTTLYYLSKNQSINNSELFVFSDGPKTEQDYPKILKVRNIIRKFKDSKNVTIAEYKENQGLSKSIIDGISKVLNQYNSAIILEDDIVTSAAFLEYMNLGLNKFSNVQNIGSICGYLEPIRHNIKNPFLLTKGTSWGWATWKRVWNEIIWDTNKLVEKIERSNKMDLYNFGGFSYYDLLLAQQRKEIDSWAIRFYTSCFLKELLHLTPPKSLCRNIGFDGTGTHCRNDSFFFIKELNKKTPSLDNISLQPNTSIHKILKRKRKIHKVRGIFIYYINRISSIFK
mgnify:CR=1 FL=1